MAAVNLPKLGMRNIKTAIAVVLCYVILKVIFQEDPFYGCIAAVITMQNRVETSFRIGLERMTGTVIGALFGVVFALLAPHSVTLIALGIALIIYFTNCLNQTDSTSIACIVFLAIMTNLTDVTPVHYSIARVIETFIGIIIAVFINTFFFPPKHVEQEQQTELS